MSRRRPASVARAYDEPHPERGVTRSDRPRHSAGPRRVRVAACVDPSRSGGTGNHSFGSWGEVFGDQIIATGILDQLSDSITHNIRGNSYRLKDSSSRPASPVRRGLGVIPGAGRVQFAQMRNMGFPLTIIHDGEHRLGHCRPQCQPRMAAAIEMYEVRHMNPGSARESP